MNILLIQLRRLGDLILTTPAIGAVHRKFPEAKITLVTSKGCAPLLPAIPHVDQQLVIRRSPADTGTLVRLTRTKFYATIDFTRNNRSALLTWLSGAELRIGSRRINRRSPVRRRAYNEFVPGRMRDLHTIDYNLSLLAPLGIQDVSLDVELRVPAEAEDAANEVRRQAGITEPFVVFHPGSARTEKFWETERWAEVITNTLNRWGMTVVLTGGSSPQEKSHIAEIESRLARPKTNDSPRVVDLSGQVDLLTLTALLRHAGLLVTVDSAPVHLAAAVKTPQIVLFGPTNPFHWRPRYEQALVLQGDSQKPVQQFEARQQRLPMKLISTQAVINAMDSLLSMPTAKVL